MAFQFTISRDDLLKAVSSQQNITGKKVTMAILSNILLQVKENQVIFTATDLDISLQKTVPAEVTASGILTLPAKKLFEVARESADATLTFEEKENNWVTITSGSSVYRLAGMLSDEFPEFPSFSRDNLIELKTEILNRLIDKTSYCIAQDKENMYTLTAALLKKIEREDQRLLQMVTSDGHRLSIMEQETGNEVDRLQLKELTLIPRRGIQEIRKFCDEVETVLLGIEEDRIVLETDDSVLVARLLDGDFPDFQALLDVIVRDNVIYVDRIRFLESLKRINLFTEDLFHAIKMEIDGNNMVLTSQNADFGSARDELEIEYSGDPLVLGFNCRYFIETLQVLDGDRVELAISSDESPCLITTEADRGFISIVMPMKL